VVPKGTFLNYKPDQFICTSFLSSAGKKISLSIILRTFYEVILLFTFSLPLTVPVLAYPFPPTYCCPFILFLTSVSLHNLCSLHRIKECLLLSCCCFSTHEEKNQVLFIFVLSLFGSKPENSLLNC
jgi:hypothetical protein